MQIRRLDFMIVQLPTRRDHAWASNTQVPIGRHTLVRLETSSGAVGWGETPALPTWGGHFGRYYGETAETVMTVGTEYLGPAILGSDPSQMSALHRTMDQTIKGHHYAKAAIDIACHDAVGRALGIPVYTLLGGKLRDGIRVAHSLGLMSMDECVREAAEVVSEGVRTIKIKTGHDPERDVAVVKAVREAVGDDIEIRVDANEGYDSVGTAISVAQRQEEWGVMLCEQPVAGLGPLTSVAEKIATPVMADESAWTASDIADLANTGAISCFSLYVTKPGGLYRARQQSEFASVHGFVSDIGGSVEMGIANAANLHLGVAMEGVKLASVCPVTTILGEETVATAGRYYTDDIVTRSFEYVDGSLKVPDGPGLGVEVDLEKVERYTVKEAQYVGV